MKRIEELKAIAEEHDGTLYPEHVVEKAEDPESSLHSAFEWDDEKAGHEYRMYQARNLIRLTVEVIKEENSDPKTVTAFVALKKDRGNGGGYKMTSQLIKTADGRDAILQTALWELKAFRNKYQHLVELTEVFDFVGEIEKIQEEEGEVDWAKKLRGRSLSGK